MKTWWASEVTVTGTPTDYYGWLEFAIDSGSDVVETGTGTLPAPVDLGDGEGVDWEVYESVPVTLSNQTIESVDINGVAQASERP